MKTTYAVWEGDPAILREFPNGRMEAYVLADAEWVEAHPADIACKAGVITKDDFESLTANDPPPST